MKWISEEDLRKHIINDNCDEGCGYIDERDIIDMEWVEDDKFIPLSVIKGIKAEINELSELDHIEPTYEDCKRDVLEIINKRTRGAKMEGEE